MKLSGGVPRDNLHNSFFRCLSASTLTCMNLSNVWANNQNCVSSYAHIEIYGFLGGLFELEIRHLEESNSFVAHKQCQMTKQMQFISFTGNTLHRAISWML